MAVTQLSADNFDATITSGKTVLVDFYATWCGPCKALAPILEEVSGDLPKDAMIGKLDIDQNQDLAKRYGVMGVPTMIVFKDGEIQAKSVGLRSAAEVKELFQN